MTSDSARGRPRDEERTAAILDATSKLLLQVGWHDLTVADIAAAAGCGLATIYRRWPTKEELVAASMRNRPMPEVPTTGDPVVDLRAFIVATAADTVEIGAKLLDLLAATRNQGALREAFDHGFAVVARTTLRRLITEVVGSESARIDLLADGISGALLVRVGLLESLDDAEGFADEAMALVAAVAESTGPS